MSVTTDLLSLLLLRQLRLRRIVVILSIRVVLLSRRSFLRFFRLTFYVLVKAIAINTTTATTSATTTATTTSDKGVVVGGQEGAGVTREGGGRGARVVDVGNE